jgi:thiamine-phosphate diphosphorylase
MAAHGASLAIHVRGHGTAVRRLFEIARALAGPAESVGTMLLVNDRVDVALALGCGAQLGRRSIPVASARAMLGDTVAVGYSAHGPAEALAAMAEGVDFVVLGTIWPTPTHPSAAGQGLEMVARVAGEVGAAGRPILAIGGVTPTRAREVMAAGGHGVAVLRGVWDATDPVAAAAEYLESMGAAG